MVETAGSVASGAETAVGVETAGWATDGAGTTVGVETAGLATDGAETTGPAADEQGTRVGTGMVDCETTTPCGAGTG